MSGAGARRRPGWYTGAHSGHFRYDPAVVERFPAVRAGVLLVSGVANGPAGAALVQECREEQAAALRRLAETPISAMPSIVAWRRAFTGFGARPTRYRNAAEALLRRLEKQGDIPAINTLVDIGNLVSVRHGLPVAVFDLAASPPPVTVRFATGEETFVDLGGGGITHPEAGEVVFCDAGGRVVARRWCWRQSRDSAASGSTTDALIVAEALHDGAEEAVRAAAEDLAGLTGRHLPDATARMPARGGP